MIAIKIWGDLACFSLPGAPERMTYPVITPTAAQGVLRSIFHKPEFDWAISRVEILRPIKFFSMTRNEVSFGATRKNGDHLMIIQSTPRQIVCLKDVAYVVHAHAVPRDGVSEPGVDLVVKYEQQLRRRVERGQFYRLPYLGCQEMFASFSEPDGEDPIDIDIDLGALPIFTDFRLGKRTPPRFAPVQVVRGVYTLEGAA